MTYDGRTDGRRLDGYTKSSLCKPNGSGELIMRRMKKGLFISFDAEKIPYHIMAELKNIVIMPAHPRTYLYRM